MDDLLNSLKCLLSFLDERGRLLTVRGVSNSTAISKIFDVKFVYLGLLPLPVDLTAERLLLLRLDLFNVLKRLLGFLDDLGSDLNGF